MTPQGGVFVDIGFNKQILVDGINSNTVPRLFTRGIAFTGVWWSFHIRPTLPYSIQYSWGMNSVRAWRSQTGAHRLLHLLARFPRRCGRITMSDHIKQGSKLRTIAIDTYPPQETRTDDFNELFCMLIKRVQDTTCDRCELELLSSDNFSHITCNDVPIFYCEKFLKAYFTETDALDAVIRCNVIYGRKHRGWRCDYHTCSHRWIASKPAISLLRVGVACITAALSQWKAFTLTMILNSL